MIQAYHDSMMIDHDDQDMMIIIDYPFAFFQKWGYPQIIIHFSGIFPYKPWSYWGSPMAMDSSIWFWMVWDHPSAQDIRLARLARLARTPSRFALASYRTRNRNSFRDIMTTYDNH